MSHGAPGAATVALVLLLAPAGLAQEVGDVGACGASLVPLPARPDDVPDPPVEAPPYRPTRGMGTDVDLGLGAVRPSPAAAFDHAWFLAVEFPAFDEPRGRAAGWVVAGWWVPFDGEPRRLATRAMVEIGYEVPGWVVLEERGGWMRLRLGGGGDGAPGSAWVSACHLAATEPALAFARWPAVMGSPLFFRTSTPHALRAGPGPDHALRLWIPGDDREAMLEPLEIRGDWMRVHVTRPSTYCVTEPEPDARVDEGWIRWRDAAMGPWVWWFTRGC